MRISTIAAAVLVLLAAGAGYYFGNRQRHVEPDTWGVASEKVAFQNRYDCESEAVDVAREQDARDAAEGRAAAAAHPESFKKFQEERSAASRTPAGAVTQMIQDNLSNWVGCEPLTFAQARAGGFELAPRSPAVSSCASAFGS